MSKKRLNLLIAPWKRKKPKNGSHELRKLDEKATEDKWQRHLQAPGPSLKVLAELGAQTKAARRKQVARHNARIETIRERNQIGFARAERELAGVADRGKRLRQRVLGLQHEMTHEHTREAIANLLSVTMTKGAFMQMVNYLREAKNYLNSERSRPGGCDWSISSDSFYTRLNKASFVADRVQDAYTHAKLVLDA